MLNEDYIFPLTFEKVSIIVKYNLSETITR